MKLCVPFNFTEGTDSLRYAFRAYRDTDNVEIHAVHFTDTPHDTVEKVIKKELLELLEEENGNDETESLTRDRVQIEIEVVDETDRESISEAIEEYTREHGIDQIIMSEEERSVFQKLLEKSSTKRVIESDVAPVTVVD